MGHAPHQATLICQLSTICSQSSDLFTGVDMLVEAIYSDPAKKPLCLQNVEHQRFTQPIEGVQAVTRIYPMAGNTRLPHHAQTEATESTIAQRPKKRSRVLNDRELLVALHQKQDKHHFWLKRQMQSLLVDVNRIRNLATKNAFCHSRDLSAIMEEFDIAQC